MRAIELFESEFKNLAISIDELKNADSARMFAHARDLAVQFIISYTDGSSEMIEFACPIYGAEERPRRFAKQIISSAIRFTRNRDLRSLSAATTALSGKIVGANVIKPYLDWTPVRVSPLKPADS